MSESPRAVRYDRDGELAILTLANPPLNLYGAATSQGLFDGIQRAEDEGARAGLYRAEGKYFSAGVDVSSFATPASPVSGGPRRSGLISRRFEESRLPVIAAGTPPRNRGPHTGDRDLVRERPRQGHLHRPLKLPPTISHRSYP
jgi:enoyl-CoA hydratase/carnithine racemase